MDEFGVIEHEMVYLPPPWQYAAHYSIPAVHGDRVDNSASIKLPMVPILCRIVYRVIAATAGSRGYVASTVKVHDPGCSLEAGGHGSGGRGLA